MRETEKLSKGSEHETRSEKGKQGSRGGTVHLGTIAPPGRPRQSGPSLQALGKQSFAWCLLGVMAMGQEEDTWPLKREEMPAVARAECRDQSQPLHYLAI